MKKINYFVQSILIFVAMISAVVVAVPSTASAACGSGPAGFDLLPPWYKGLQSGDCSIKSPAEAGGLGSFLTTIILNVIEAMLYITGYIALGFIIWGGFKFMLNGDNASGVASARKTILNAVIGLIISIFAVAIVNVIAGAF